MNHPHIAAAALALVALAGCSSTTSSPTEQKTPTAAASGLPEPAPSPASSSALDAFPVRHMSIREMKTADTTAHVTLDDGAAVPASIYTVDVPLDGKPAPITPGSKCITTPTEGSVCIVKAQTIQDRDKHAVISVWVTSTKQGIQCEFSAYTTPGARSLRTCNTSAQ